MLNSEPPLLKITGASVVKNGTRILDNLSLEIAPGQHTAILGPNGSGKSSLIKLITRQHYPLARPDGEPVITIFGRARWDVFALRSLLGIVSADLHQSFVSSGLPGREVVLSGFFASQGLAAHHEVTSEMEGRAEEALKLAHAAHLADKPMEQMSTGEARRILIARALVPDPRALLLDEPTTGLDIGARRRFLQTVQQIAQSGKTIILVTHHVEEVIPEISRAVLLRGGKVFQDGSTADVLTSSHLSALFGEPIEVRHQSNAYTAEVHGDKHGL
ncbi:MAG: ABC transporter ATP-binding protein [Janthinobacterium lividum]